MLSEAGIMMSFENIAFGKFALSFLQEAQMSMHREHLIVYYSVELFIRAHAIAHRKSYPTSNERLDTFYGHFEAAIPLVAKFRKYSNDESLFVYSATHWFPPLINWPQEENSFSLLHRYPFKAPTELYRLCKALQFDEKQDCQGAENRSGKGHPLLTDRII